MSSSSPRRRCVTVWWCRGEASLVSRVALRCVALSLTCGAHRAQIEAQVKVGDDAATVKDLFKQITTAENEYQVRVSLCMSHLD